MKRLLVVTTFVLITMSAALPVLAQSGSLTLTGEIYDKWDTPWEITVDNGIAYIPTGLTGLRIVDVSDPASLQDLGSVLNLGLVRDVAVSNGIAYAASSDTSLAIVDVSTPSAPTHLWTPDEYSSTWSSVGVFGLALQGDYLYAACGSRLRFLDISDPSAPTVEVEIDSVSNADAIAVNGNMLYVADNGQYKLQIYDITDPVNPAGVATWSDTAAFNYFTADYIHVKDDTLLAGNYILDVSDPFHPTKLGNIFSSSPRDAFLNDARLYAGTDEGLTIFDASDLSNVTELGSVDYSEVFASGSAGSWSMWADGSDVFATINGRNHALISLDASDPSSITLQSEPVGTGGYLQDISLSGTTMYIADYGMGLRYVDLSTPASPVEVGSMLSSYYNEFTNTLVEGTKLYATKSSDSLFVYDITVASAPTLIGEADIGSEPNDLALSGNLLWVANAEGFSGFDVSNTSAISEVSSTSLSDDGDGIDVQGDYLYVVQQYGDLVIYDISTPSSPVLVGSDGFGSSQPYDIDVEGEYAYIASHGGGFDIEDISDPSNPSGLSGVSELYSAQVVQVDGDYAYIGTEDNGLHVIDISDPNNPIKVDSIATDYAIEDLSVSDNVIVTAENFRIGLYTLSTSSVGDEEADASLVTRYSLGPAYPNPFNPSTTLSYTLPRESSISLSVYNLIGRRVANLDKGVQSAGRHTVHFKAQDLPSGTYFAVLETDGKRMIQKMLLLR